MLTSRKKLNPVNWNEDQDVVVSFIHWDGTNCLYLSQDQVWEVFCLGNGFGDCTSEQLAEINSGFDWSHVRDSDDAGWKRMADRIREMVPATLRVAA